MIRVKLAAAIMVLIAAASGISTYVVEKKYLRLENMLEEIHRDIKTGDKKSAAENAEKMTEYWDDVYKLSSLFVRGAKITPIQASVAKIKPLIEADAPELEAEVESLKDAVKSLYTEERPIPAHVF